MDRADAEIKEEYFMGNSNWSVLLLRRSWWIGKKVAIAGAAITSAPVIIPPLFVLSTLGLAFSFPFGIYLAGYVCTDKIMSFLLPVPVLKEDLREKGCHADKGDEMVVDEEIWEKGEILDEERESDVESEVKEASTWKGVGDEDEMSKSGDLMNYAAAVEELRKSDFANPANEVRGVQLVDEAREDGTAVVLGAYEESNKKENEPPNLCSDRFSVVELREEGKADDNLATEELREDGGEEEERLRVANSFVVAEDKELSEECRTEVPRLMSDYALSALIVP